MPTNDLPAETPLLKRLNEQRIAAAHTRKEILERAADGEDLSSEDNQTFERANKQIDRYGKLIADEIKRLQEDKDLSAAYEAGVQKRDVSKREGRESTEDDKSLAGMMRRDLIASKGGETRNGGVYQQLPEHRTLNVTTATKGPETVPVTLVESLYEKIFDDSAILQTNPTILRTQSGEVMKLPRLTALNFVPPGTTPIAQAAVRVAEAGAISPAEPNFDQLQLDAYKYAQYTQVSRELVEDGVLDIEALIGRILGRNMANYIGFDLTLGTGTAQPRGVRTVVPAGNKVATPAGGLWTTFVDADKFFDVIAKLKPGYRRNAKWLVNDQSLFFLRKMKMGSVYAWEPNLQTAGQPDSFLGYQILSDPNIPVPAAAAGITALFGDFSAYYVRFVKDVRVEWSMEFAWVNDLLSVKAVMRADGDAVDDAAFAGIDSIA